ncbi:hypothetical protein EG327_008896 [Venturia inaequalis]|uniref:Uncharacterized protein n=1 Tax=Venturia inaequalis TaxID=5025 RepID=A0A8H3YW44_VENIN|nr:hypothetical protein EG327_008896 [Venturia inaequalis]
MFNFNFKAPVALADCISDADLKELCQTLWGWNCCAMCTAEGACANRQCVWSKRSELDPFLQFYENKTWYMRVASNRSAFRSHRDFIAIIKFLKERIDTPRSVLAEEHWLHYSTESRPLREDHDHAFEVAIGIMTMVDCSHKFRSGAQCELGLTTTIWRDDDSARHFMESLLPTRNPSRLFVQELTAERLRKAGIKIRGTNDLANHLVLDRESRVLLIFHHTSFLKWHLRASRRDESGGDEDALKSEIVPRKLALEIIDSYVVLFSHKKSRRILRRLILTEGFDPDCMPPGSSGYRRAREADSTYTHLGSRLEMICREVEDPTPRGIQALAERLNKQRHVMIAAVAGILATVFVGMASLGVGIFQAWVSYQQLMRTTV